MGDRSGRRQLVSLRFVDAASFTQECIHTIVDAPGVNPEVVDDGSHDGRAIGAGSTPVLVRRRPLSDFVVECFVPDGVLRPLTPDRPQRDRLAPVLTNKVKL